MYVTDYFSVFPERTKDEIRTMRFVDESSNGSTIPDGLYVVREFYCTDLSCNCQRVMLRVKRVVDEIRGTMTDVATVCFTWRRRGIDPVWDKIDAETGKLYLDPFQPRSSYAEELFSFVEHMLRIDTAYVTRLKRHYDEIRANMGKCERNKFELGINESQAGASQPMTRRGRQRLLKRKLRK